jgi:hypothetical protein
LKARCIEPPPSKLSELKDQPLLVLQATAKAVYSRTIFAQIAQLQAKKDNAKHTSDENQMMSIEQDQNLEDRNNPTNENSNSSNDNENNGPAVVYLDESSQQYASSARYPAPVAHSARLRSSSVYSAPPDYDTAMISANSNEGKEEENPAEQLIPEELSPRVIEENDFCDIKSQIKHGDILKFWRQTDLGIQYYHYAIAKRDPKTGELFCIHLWDPRSEIGGVSNWFDFPALSPLSTYVNSLSNSVKKQISNEIKDLIRSTVGKLNVQLLDVHLNSVKMLRKDSGNSECQVKSEEIVKPQIYETHFDLVHKNCKVTIDRRTILVHNGRRIEGFSPEETVARAESQLGKVGYNLFVRNCEHFAVWSRFGVAKSLQVVETIDSAVTAASIVAGLATGVIAGSNPLSVLKGALLGYTNGKVLSGLVCSGIDAAANFNSSPNDF